MVQQEKSNEEQIIEALKKADTYFFSASKKVDEKHSEMKNAVMGSAEDLTNNLIAFLKHFTGKEKSLKINFTIAMIAFLEENWGEELTAGSDQYLGHLKDVLLISKLAKDQQSEQD